MKDLGDEITAFAQGFDIPGFDARELLAEFDSADVSPEKGAFFDASEFV